MKDERRRRAVRVVRTDRKRSTADFDVSDAFRLKRFRQRTDQAARVLGVVN